MEKVLYWFKTEGAKASDQFSLEMVEEMNKDKESNEVEDEEGLPENPSVSGDRNFFSKHIHSDKLIIDLDLQENSYWGKKEQPICSNMDLLDSQSNNTILNFTINCHTFFKESDLGTGNWISAFYSMRLAALKHDNIGIYMACDDAVEEKNNLILPWLMGYWPARKPDKQFPWPHPDAENKPLHLPSYEKVCGDYDEVPVGYMTPFIRYELRRMAIAIGGIPDNNHPSASFAKQYLWSDNDSEDEYQLPTPQSGDKPLVPGMKFDDVAIHFRCGDIMGALYHPSFGFMKFTAYKKWISPEAKSIGIVTNPFDSSGQHRPGADQRPSILDRCRIVVTELKKYLENEFPSALVSIRNDVSETIPMAYTRLIMANQTFASISSFGAFPVVATFGTGYIKKPDFPKVPNKWIPFVSKMYDDVVMMDEPETLMATQVRRWFMGNARMRTPEMEKDGMEKVLYWFKTEGAKASEMVST